MRVISLVEIASELVIVLKMERQGLVTSDGVLVTYRADVAWVATGKGSGARDRKIKTEMGKVVGSKCQSLERRMRERPRRFLRMAQYVDSM